MRPLPPKLPSTWPLSSPLMLFREANDPIFIEFWHSSIRCMMEKERRDEPGNAGMLANPHPSARSGPAPQQSRLHASNYLRYYVVQILPTRSHM